MAKLSFEEFMKLSEEDKCTRYKDLTDKDKQRARMTESMICGKPIGYIKLTEEQKKKGKAMIDETMKMIEISCKSND